MKEKSGGPKGPGHFRVLYVVGIKYPAHFFALYRMGLWGPPYKASSSPKGRRKDSAINRTPKRKPYENASRSVMLCISFMQSSNFSSVSFCLSVSVPSSSSRFRATSLSSSLSRLSPRVHCSKGEMLPYARRIPTDAHFGGSLS